MKKFIIIFITFCYIVLGNILSNPSFANHSENSFQIVINHIPDGKDETSKKHSGLSGGTVTAIALGSTFGGLVAAGGILWLNKKDKLICTRILGGDKPYFSICYTKKFIEKLQKELEKYEFLYNAILNSELKDNCSEKYIFVEDSTLEPNTFHRVYIDTTTLTKTSKIKILQYSNSNLTESHLFTKDKVVKLEKINSDVEKLSIKQTTTSIPTDNQLYIDTVYKGKNIAKYALIVVYY